MSTMVGVRGRRFPQRPPFVHMTGSTVHCQYTEIIVPVDVLSIVISTSQTLTSCRGMARMYIGASG